MSLTLFLSRPFRVGAFWAAFGGWLIVLCTLSSQPSMLGAGPGGFPIDKVLHFLYFFGGGIVLMLICRHTFGWRGWRLAFAVAAIMAIIGAADEWHQTYTPGRQGGDPLDWAADCAGGGAAALTAGMIYGWLRTREKPGA